MTRERVCNRLHIWSVIADFNKSDSHDVFPTILNYHKLYITSIDFRFQNFKIMLAIGRKSIEIGDSYQIREPAFPYIAHFGVKKGDIGSESTWLWDI